MEKNVLIGIRTQEFARRADFYDYINLIDKPIGTGVTYTHGQSPAKGANLIIQQALDRSFSHVLFIDDDCLVKPDIIKRLMEHDKDIVTGLYLTRHYPHKPIIFDEQRPDGRCLWSFLTDGKKGLIEIVACGLGAVLVKTNVFRRIKELELVEPVSMGCDSYVTLGELEKDNWCDDLSLWQRARRAGFKLYCDLDCLVGHVASCAVWPHQVDGKWFTVYNTNGEGIVSFPAIVPQSELVGK